MISGCLSRQITPVKPCLEPLNNNDSPPEPFLPSHSFRHTAVTIEQQEPIKLILKLLFSTSHGADDQRMLVATDNTREALPRATQQQRLASRTIPPQPQFPAHCGHDRTTRTDKTHPQTPLQYKSRCG